MRLVPAPTFRLALLAALAAGLVNVPAASSADPASATQQVRTALAVGPVADSTATAQLRSAADAARRNAGLDPLFHRGAYGTNATRIATAALNGDPSPDAPGDNAPFVHTTGFAYDLTYQAALSSSIAAVVSAAREVLRYPMHTDGGWSVVSSRGSDGSIRYGVALVVGWPNPTMSRTSGCSTAGYCWSNGGLNPHLPWTRNTVKWYLSTSNLPAAGESLVKSAIAKLNAVRGVGAHVVYGGKTSVTSPTSTRRFVIRFGSGCSSSAALGCTTTSTQGTYRMVFQARTILTLSRYRANPSTTWWTGTIMHEIAHGMGLGHYDSTYGGTYQLMRWANGPDYIKTGDANGLRAIAKPGALSASVSARATTSGAYSLVVRTANAGLGGIRAIRTQCTDASGAWRTVGLIAGTYDTKSANRTVGSFDPPAGSSRKCRAIVRSKTSVVYTGSITVRG